MPKNMLLKTNLIVCLVIIAGFTVASMIYYRTSHSTYFNNIEHISDLTSEGIYYRFKAIFAEPLNISLTMANDHLLKSFLLGEDIEEDESYIKTIQNYLSAYKKEYEYDSVFLASAKTLRYYNFNGINRILTVENPENVWYYSFLESDLEYDLNIDNDEAGHNEITVFINCRIKGEDGTTLGIIGVGFKINYLQNILSEYAEELGVDIYLINENGDIEIAEDSTGWQPVNFFDVCGYLHLKEEILGSKDTDIPLSWWIPEESWQNYIVAQYIPELNWHLVVEHNTSLFEKNMNRQLLKSTVAATMTCVIVLLAISYVIVRYNKQIIKLTAQVEREKYKAFRTATEQLYDNICEINVSKNRAIGEHTKKYFEGFGIAGNAPFDEAICVIADKLLKEEYRAGYVAMFSPENIIREYQNGNENLEYEMLSDYDGTEYHWTRIVAHIYCRKDDDSICMFTYHKNIEAEKRKEEWLMEQAQIDGLTNVYNKMATEHHIKKILSNAKEGSYAFFIIDIDDFKQINDEYGHAYGDLAIADFVAIIKKCFRNGDIIGRIGGDEFVAFLPVTNAEWIEKKAAELSEALDTEFSSDSLSCKISASIGVAVIKQGSADFETLYKNADAALYETKRRGKNGYTIYHES